MGLQIAGLPGRWFTELASPPNGEIQENLSLDRRLGAIGDSAVVEAGARCDADLICPEQLKVFKAFAVNCKLEVISSRWTITMILKATLRLVSQLDQ